MINREVCEPITLDDTAGNIIGTFYVNLREIGTYISQSCGIRLYHCLNAVSMKNNISLIIHQEKAKKITTVTTIWIRFPNCHKFCQL